MENGAKAGNCRRIARHPPVGRCHPAQQPLCLCRDGKRDVGGEVPVIALSDQPPTGFVGAHFPPTTDSPIRAVRLSVGPAPIVLLPSLVASGGTGLQGLGSLNC